MSQLLAKIEKVARSGRYSPRMVAILAYLFDRPWAEPAILSILTTSDGGVLLRHEGEIGHDHFLCNISTLRGNWGKVLEAAELTPEEREEADALFEKRSNEQ